jgi:hypothetical protein
MLPAPGPADPLPQEAGSATDGPGMRRQLRAARASEDAAHRYEDWGQVHLGLTRFLAETRSFRGLQRGDERVFLALADVHLIEPRPSGGRCVGGFFVPGFDELTSVDVGTLVVTDRRALLHGRTMGETHEWLFRDVTAVHHDPDAPWTVLEGTDRPTAAGFFYGHADVPLPPPAAVRGVKKGSSAA